MHSTVVQASRLANAAKKLRPTSTVANHTKPPEHFSINQPHTDGSAVCPPFRSFHRHSGSLNSPPLSFQDTQLTPLAPSPTTTMILRRPLLADLTATTAALYTPRTCIRTLHYQIPMRPVPKPIPFIPDHTAFLSAIGRGLSAHAAKIPSWEALFTLTSAQLKELGVEPPRARKYLLMWRERFRNGEYGIGGDCKYVSEDGVAELKLVEAPVLPSPFTGTISPRSAAATATHDPGTRKVVINVPVGADGPAEPVEQLVGEKGVGVKGVVVKGAKTIKGPYVEIVKGSGGLKAKIRLQEGIWEIRRGHKVDGGERRKAEVRAKRRAAENKEKAR